MEDCLIITLTGFECRPKGVVSPDGAVSSSNQTADLCTPHTCLHGGSCTTTNSTSLTCFCPSGYTGMYCDVNINDCTSQPCLNGICLDKINGFQCFCTPGKLSARTRHIIVNVHCSNNCYSSHILNSNKHR